VLWKAGSSFTAPALQTNRKYYLLLPGHGFESYAIGNFEHSFIHPNDAAALPFTQTLVDVLARHPHKVGKLVL
jgi:hypothetical protein